MGIEAIELFHHMPKEFINDITYVCVLNACSHAGLGNAARSIFNNILQKTEFIYTTMVSKILFFFAFYLRNSSFLFFVLFRSTVLVV